MQFYPFPEIKQFRHAVSNIRYKVDKDNNLPSLSDINLDDKKATKEVEEKVYLRLRATGLPTLNYRGTVKLHGMHCDIVYNKSSNSIYYQSRGQIITEKNDATGFVRFINANIDKEVFIKLLSNIECNNNIILGGEFCGGNIQKSVALTQLQKMFVIYNIVIDGEEKDIANYSQFDLPQYNVHYILKFPHYTMKINFNQPEMHQNDLNDITMKVEKECPVGKYFGVSGIGEGIVWTCLDDEYTSPIFWFKVKGSEHSSTKVKKLANVNIEKATSINDFVERVTTESRLDQGYTHIKQTVENISKKEIELYIRWIISDIVKEESDMLEASGLTMKDVSSKISNIARICFIKKLNSKE
jgi:hypothetical protein